MEEGLRGVWRIDLGCFVVLGDYEKSPLKDLRAEWRKDFRTEPKRVSEPELEPEPEPEPKLEPEPKPGPEPKPEPEI